MKAGTRVEMTEECRQMFPKGSPLATVLTYRPSRTSWRGTPRIKVIRDGYKSHEVWSERLWKEVAERPSAPAEQAGG